MLVMARGVGQGRAAALFTVLGMTVGAGMVQLPLVIFGVTSLIKASPPAFAALQWMGAAYLVWLGLRLIFTAHDATRQQDTGTIKPLAAAREGMIANLVRGPSHSWLRSCLSSSIRTEARLCCQLLVLGATQKMTGVLVLGKDMPGFGQHRLLIMARPRVRLWQQRIAGFCIVGLGFRMAFGGGSGRLNKRTRKEPRWGSTCVHRQECDRDAIPANGS